MKHVIMIIAHKNIEQLSRLVECLKHESLDVFIHLDSKWKISQNEIMLFQKQYPDVIILEKRISGVLDTWSLVEITMELINKALEKERVNNEKYGYFYLLSGQDYPIKSTEYIVEYLNQNYPKPLIDCTPESPDNWVHSTFKRIRHVNIYNKINKLSDNKKIQKICKIPLYLYQEILTIIVGAPSKHLKRMNIKLYGGSAWWTLPREIVCFIRNEYQNNREMIAWFRKATTPEETFFQTLTMMSEFSSEVNVNSPNEVQQNCMTYAYFEDDFKPATGHPYIFTSNEIEKICSLPHLFARKFDLEFDKEIFDEIDKKCRNTKVSEISI